MAVYKQRALHWTLHSRNKMKFYKLSEQRVRRVINSPKRVEHGIVENTIAMMQPVSPRRISKNEVWKQEIWVMVQDDREKRKIISAWRYYGMTKPREEIVVDSILNEYKDYVMTNLED